MVSELKQAQALKVSAPREGFVRRLHRCIADWRKFTETMHKTRKRMLQHYANEYYSGGYGAIQPLNLIYRGVNIIVPYLVARNPRVIISAKTGVPASRSFAQTMELALEHLFREIRLAQQTLRPAAFNALFGYGVVKTGIMSDYKVEVFGYLHDVGQPYADNVDPEDYIGDPRAKHREQMAIEGNAYCLPEEFVKTSGLFKNYDGLKPIEGETSDNRVGSIQHQGNDHYSGFKTLRPMVRLVDLWIPDEGIVVTIPEEGEGDKILRTVEYDGPEEGPYDVLTLSYFPDGLFPVPPVFAWLGINAIVNRLAAKMNEQALREKKILVYDLASADDAQLIEKAEDGKTVGVRNPESVKEVEFGGVSDANFAFMQFLEHQFSITGGNLYTIGGREAQAETLGQEQMLQANASKQLQDMVVLLHEFTKSIVNKLAWYLWSDPYIQIPVIKRFGEFSLRTELTPDVREGDFLDYTFDIEPYSMSMLTPEVRYQRLLQLIGQVVLPTVGIAAQQGDMLNVSELVKEAARYLDVRNVDLWWNSSMPQQAAPNPYQPLAGSGKSNSAPVGKGQADNRFNADNAASAFSNLQQHSTRTANDMHSSALSTPNIGD